MRPSALLVVPALVAASVALSGCALLEDLGRPDLHVQRSGWNADEWTRDPTFQVAVTDPGVHEVRIDAVSTAGQTRTANGTTGAGLGEVSIELPDGTWTLTYYVDGHKWERIAGVRLDTTPPLVTGLATVVEAPQGSATLGQGATVEGGASVSVVEQRSGTQVGTSLPLVVTGLRDGVHGYDVRFEDAAGNVAVHTIQVRAGDAVGLPEGAYTFGIVARYRQDVLLWDLTDPSAYLSREAAALQTASMSSEGYLGSGLGITPQDAQVKAVADSVVALDDNSFEAALALFEWMADNLEYDDERLELTGLLSPRDTLLDTEDPQGDDRNGDGVVDGGAGNGVKGGVCRDLAAAYVSLLRAAGVPSRLVAGYLAGQVNGFHAWVEVYVGTPAGTDQSPWLPVDVSPIDGDFNVSMVMNAFGIHHPSHLAMRAVTEAQEDQPWSEALRLQSSYTDSPPDVELSKDVDVTFQAERELCFDSKTLQRWVAADCGNRVHFPRFVASAEMVLDYGVLVRSASPGTKLEVSLAYPIPPVGEAEWLSYGETFVPDTSAGVARATWQR